MKRNYNGVSKGKVIPLTEVKPGMVFRIVRKGTGDIISGWLFWVDGTGSICCACENGQAPNDGHDGHDHWLGGSGHRQALVINSFDKRAI